MIEFTASYKASYIVDCDTVSIFIKHWKLVILISLGAKQDCRSSFDYCWPVSGREDLFDSISHEDTTSQKAPLMHLQRTWATSVITVLLGCRVCYDVNAGYHYHDVRMLVLPRWSARRSESDMNAWT
jgi:hypothetical protein